MRHPRFIRSVSFIIFLLKSDSSGNYVLFINVIAILIIWFLVRVCVCVSDWLHTSLELVNSESRPNFLFRKIRDVLIV